MNAQRELPMCPKCGGTIIPAVDGTHCQDCGLELRMIPQAIPEGDHVQVGDLHGHKLSDGRWIVDLGPVPGSAGLGFVMEYVFTWWAAVRPNAVTASDGWFWGEYAEPSVLGWKNTLEDAIELFNNKAGETPL